MRRAACLRFFSTVGVRNTVWAVLTVGSSIGVAAAGSAVRQEDLPFLKAEASVERSLAGSDRHSYRIALRPGEVTTVTVEERGIDIIIEVSTGDGSVMVAANDEWGGGREKLDLFGEAAGTYVLTVQPRFERGPAGAYVVSLTPSRAGTERDRVLHDTWKLRTESQFLRRAGEVPQALSLIQRAIAMAETVRNPDDLYLALLRLDAAALHVEMLNYDAAREMANPSLKVLTAVLGPDHLRTTDAQRLLSTLYTHAGDYATAERLIVDVLERQERVAGPHHPLRALSLMSLSSLLKARGDYEGNERALKRALALVSEWYGPDDNLLAIVQNNLGALYLDMRDYERAETHLQRSLAIREKRLGKYHADLAEVVQNLGIVARQKKDYAAAEQYYLWALSIRERSVGLDHPIVAGTLNNLANVYAARGKYAQSLEIHLRALAITEKHSSPWEHPVLSLGNIARTYAAMGDFPNALKFQERVEAALEAQTALNLAIGSERQKIAFLNSIAERTERTISFHLQLQPENPAAARLAARAVLQRKGRVLDAMIDTVAALRQRADGEEQSLLDRLDEATTRFAQLALAGPGRTPMEEYRRKVEALDDVREKLEAEISRRDDDFRSAFTRVTLEAVQAAIPTGAALLEFAVYRPYDPRAASPTVAYGASRYAVFVVRPDTTVAHDLGDAAAIDTAIERYRAALQDPDRDDFPRLARALDEQVMGPIRSAIRDTTRLLISPDGQLALIPFEALVDKQARFLIERYPITYVSAGRDLLRLKVPRAHRTGAVAIADPLFGEPNVTPNLAGSVTAASTPARRSVTSGVDLGSMYFAPLAGTLQEARAVQSVFPETKILTGGNATEAAVKQMQAPRILHIATHGFFLQERGREPAKPGGPPGETRAIPAARARIENPLLRSGLALARANLTDGGKEDGILTALEAARLNLWGTQLVTLSACETGVGVVRNGDGVYGLRRSVFLAGAETLVMSLWQVSDYATREMMTAYYQGLKAGLGRGEALRRVQLSMLKRKGREHPFYWAGFIQAGEWANLEGRR